MVNPIRAFRRCYRYDSYVHRLRALAALAAAVSLAALIPSAAQAARTPQLRSAFVIDPTYCTAWGVTPRLQLTLSAPGKVMFWAYQVQFEGEKLPLPTKSAGPKTLTLPAGTSTLSFTQAFGKTAGSFPSGAPQIFLALPYTGWQVGRPYLDQKGFTNICL